MARRTPNLVWQGSRSTGATALSLTIPAEAPYRDFSAVLDDGDVVDVMVINRDLPSEWQQAEYTYAADVLTFVRRIDGSSEGTVSFSEGHKDVYVTARAGAAGTGWTTVTANRTAFAGDMLDCDTSGAAFTVTLPADPIDGDRISFNDFAGTWGTNALSIDPNGNEFEDLGDGTDPAEPLSCSDPAQFSIVFADGLYRIR
jgi:hypothetical protein